MKWKRIIAKPIFRHSRYLANRIKKIPWHLPFNDASWSWSLLSFGIASQRAIYFSSFFPSLLSSHKSQSFWIKLTLLRNTVYIIKYSLWSLSIIILPMNTLQGKANILCEGCVQLAAWTNVKLNSLVPRRFYTAFVFYLFNAQNNIMSSIFHCKNVYIQP